MSHARQQAQSVEILSVEENAADARFLREVLTDSGGSQTDGGIMPFMEEEAVEKVGKQVWVRDDSLAHESIVQGASGTVGDAHAEFPGVWVVSVQFTFASDHWLFLPFSKEEYARTLEER